MRRVSGRLDGATPSAIATFGRSRCALPHHASKLGWINVTVATSALNGLPGRPTTGVPSSVANIIEVSRTDGDAIDDHRGVQGFEVERRKSR